MWVLERERLIMVDVWKELEFVVFMNIKSLFSAVYMLQCLCDVRYNDCANDTHVYLLIW